MYADIKFTLRNYYSNRPTSLKRIFRGGYPASTNIWKLFMMGDAPRHRATWPTNEKTTKVNILANSRPLDMGEMNHAK